MENLLQKTHTSLDCAHAKTCVENHTNVETCISCLSDQYFGGQIIDYSCEHKRSVYLLRYLLVHVQEVWNTLEGLRNNAKLPNSWPSPVRVISIGGGPGFDIAAFKKFVIERGFYDKDCHAFQISRLDKVKDWDNLAHDVINLFSQKDYFFEHKRINKDLNNLSTCLEGTFDVFLLSYVVSELNDEECARLGKAINDKSGNSAVVIFNDRNQSEVWQKIQAITSCLNIADTFTKTNQEWCGLFYPDSLKAVTNPKLKMTSIRHGVIIKNDR